MATLRVALEKSAEGRVARLPAEGAITLAHVALCAGVPRGTARMAFCRGMLGEQIGTGRHGAILVHVSTAAPWILACRASKGL